VITLRPRFPESISRRPRSVGEAREIQSAENIAETVEKHFETGEKLKEGWAYAGDIGTIDEGGFLRLLGCTSDLIIRGGVNVHPSEVEAAIAEHEGCEKSRWLGSPICLKTRRSLPSLCPREIWPKLLWSPIAAPGSVPTSGRANLRS
jgi:acyl-CoA synthetase (AMP-forming)/AMP-acid ligase II